MPAYHSKQNEADVPTACGCALLPLKTEVRGPAGAFPVGEDDIIDETLNYFRANVLFRFFEFNSLSDRTLVYLTAFTQLCLVKLEKIEDKPSALRQLKLLAIGSFLIPGDSGFVLGGYFPAPNSKSEGDSYRAYFKQAREELTLRLCDRMFEADGRKSKWWQQYSKRRFMGLELKE